MNTKFDKALDIAEAKPLNMQANVMMPVADREELRSRKVTLHLKPSEYDTFVWHLGRETASNALRNLVLEFNRRCNEKEK